MKIRNGFVSNSSSSSFCIYGFRLSEDSLIKIYKDLNEVGCEEEDDDDCFYNALDVISDKLGLENYVVDDRYYLGISWKEIGKDIKGETREQFIDKIEKMAKDLNDKYEIDIKCDTLQKAWRDG